MLRTASYTWQQAALSSNARLVFDLGRELYERLSTLGGHMDELGRSLSGSIKAYNRAVGSLESRVFVSARKLNELGVTEAVLDTPRPVEETPRALSAAELLEDEIYKVGFAARPISSRRSPEDER
jgi:DNA recombination protein RmuC